MDTTYLLFIFCFVSVTLSAVKERQITSSFCYGFVQNWRVPNPAHVVLECNENEVIDVVSVEFKRPNKVGDDDVGSVDPNACSRDHRLGVDECLARHRHDAAKAKLERDCNLKQSCDEEVELVFMHLLNLEGTMNCNNLQNCSEVTRTTSCYARRVDVTYKCKSGLTVGDSQTTTRLPVSATRGSQTAPGRHPVGVTRGAQTTRTIFKVATLPPEAESSTFKTNPENSTSSQEETNTGNNFFVIKKMILMCCSCKL